MKLGYKFYRNNLIKLMILSVPVLYILWEHLHGGGNPNDEPRALILLTVLIVVGNVGLFIAMRRAKKREQAEFSQSSISISNTKQQPTPEEATRKRKNMRRFMSFWCIVGGLLFAIFGHEWLVNGLPVHWVGYFLILLGILGLAGVNIFYGGPLDLRLDEQQQPPHQSEDQNDHVI